MKLLIFLFALLSACRCISNDQEVYLRAHQSYTQKEYARALELYQSIQNKGSSVWYNMGNCAYQLKDYLHARLYWKQAENQATRHQLSDIGYNIMALDQKIGTKDHSRSAVREQLKRFAALVGLFSWQFLFIFFWFALWFVLRSRFKSGRAVAILCLCGMVLCGVGLGSKYIQGTQKIGMVTAHNAPLYAGPDSRYHVLGTADAMSEVRVQEVRDRWCKVQYNATTGWMAIDTLAVV